MPRDEPRRNVIKRLKDAGFELVSTDGIHDKWRHPSGAWVPLPRHRVISPGVVRRIDQVIKESKGK